MQTWSARRVARRATDAGALRKLAGDPAGAADRFRKSIETGMIFAPEFHFAKGELKALEK